jgi:hypothetical protein
MNTTIWTRLGGTKFVAFLLLAVWAMWMIQSGVKADKDLLDFVKYVFWGFVFGNAAVTGAQTLASSVAASKAGTAPATTKDPS